MTFDIATVTFDLEYPMIEIQARSIEKYFKIDVGKIILINNSNSNIDYCKSWYGKFANQVEIHQIADMFDVDINKGYINQMIAKIKLSKYCTSENLILLDSKNWFINNITENKVVRNNKLAGGSTGIAKFWEPHWKNSLDLFGLGHGFKNQTQRTPFFVKTQTLNEIQSILPDIENLLASGYYTEFGLINAYIIKKYHDWHNYFFDYDADCSFNTGVWPGYREDLSVDLIDRLYGYEYGRQHTMLATGVHRRVWNTLTIEEKNSLAERWDSQRILNHSTGLDLIQHMCDLN